MRQTVDGDFSPCAAASEENVGKRRCKHVPGGVKFEVEVNTIKRGLKEVIISDNYAELDNRDKLTVVKKFASTLEPISKEDLKSVLDELRTM